MRGRDVCHTYSLICIITGRVGHCTTADGSSISSYPASSAYSFPSSTSFSHEFDRPKSFAIPLQRVAKKKISMTKHEDHFFRCPWVQASRGQTIGAQHLHVPLW